MRQRLGDPRLGFETASQSSRKVATVLFADIKGSTKAISAIDAEAAMLRIRPMINAMAAAMREQGGTVIEVRGDGILSGFGALDSLEHHPLAACRACRLSSGRPPRSGSSPGLPVRIGIHAGEVIVTPASRQFPDGRHGSSGQAGSGGGEPNPS